MIVILLGVPLVFNVPVLRVVLSLPDVAIGPARQTAIARERTKCVKPPVTAAMFVTSK